MATTNAINALFFGNKESASRQVVLQSLIDRATDKTKQLELETIVYGFPGSSNKEIGVEQYQRLVGFLRQTTQREADGEQVYMNINVDKNQIRSTIKGDDAVYRYCEEDRLPENAEFVSKFLMKMENKDAKESKEKRGPMERAIVEDLELGYRVNLKTEKKISPVDESVRELKRSWERSTKTYRIIQRESFVMGPFVIDCSRVRQGTGRTLEESRVLDGSAHYEVEIEFKPDRVPEGLHSKEILRRMLVVILRVLRVLRGSWFLLRSSDIDNVVKEYADFTGQLYREGSLPQFIGPMPITLERQMLRDVRMGGYTVTQKADGERALLHIAEDGKVYFIYRTMRVEATGLEITDKSICKTILDGEVITKTKDGTEIHPPMYLVFDCYMVNGKPVNNLPLVSSGKESESVASAASAAAAKSTKEEIVSRLDYASMILDIASTPGNFSSVWGEDRHVVRLSMKPFVIIPKAPNDVVEKTIVSLMDTEVPYGTDGVIFTPAESSVNNYSGEKLFDIRGTWSDVMKWKPPHDNTIDFLLKIKDADKSESKLFREGELFVIGNLFTDEKLYMLQDMPDRDFREEMRNSENKVVPFQGGVSKIQLEVSTDGSILARSGESVMSNTIVECAWDSKMASSMDDLEGGWVIRNIRWDKTSLYKQGKIYGTMNTERTAKSVWETTVKDPIALEDLWTSTEIYTDDSDGGGEQTREGYFNRRGSREQSLLARMVDFHNLVVKRHLLVPVVRKGKYITNVTDNQLIVDIACGKGGDIPRFMKSRARFILGIDVEPDNILNRDDGAIVRYLNHRMKGIERQGKRPVNMRFALADCGKDLFANDTGMDEYSQEVLKKNLRSGGILSSGVDRISCMFAVHYFFKDETTITTFFNNISKLLRSKRNDDGPPPCFIACCYDGDKVVQLLEAEGGDERRVSHYENDKLAWSIRGDYKQEDVGNGDIPVRGLGHEISVYIETINNTHTEYLVGDEELYYRAKMAGLRAPTEEEAISLGYTSGGGTFEELFDKTSPEGTGKARDMYGYEKKLSFLYRWFILVPITKDD